MMDPSSTHQIAQDEALAKSLVANRKSARKIRAPKRFSEASWSMAEKTKAPSGFSTAMSRGLDKVHTISSPSRTGSLSVAEPMPAVDTSHPSTSSKPSSARISIGVTSSGKLSLILTFKVSEGLSISSNADSTSSPHQKFRSKLVRADSASSIHQIFRSTLFDADSASTIHQTPLTAVSASSTLSSPLSSPPDTPTSTPQLNFSSPPSTPSSSRLADSIATVTPPTTSRPARRKRLSAMASSSLDAASNVNGSAPIHKARAPAKRKMGNRNAQADADLASSSSPIASDSPTSSEAKRPKPTIQKARRAPAKRNLAIDFQASKPLPVGKPPVWAEKRQQLCETLPYYRAFQSGAYSNDKMVKGLLINKEVGLRDQFTSAIVICSRGGGRTLDVESGSMTQSSDTSDSGFTVAFQNAQGRQQPIVVIAGNQNRISPSKLPHNFNVLDSFHVTDLWTEKINNVATGMVRLEKINLETESWWSAQTTEPPTEMTKFQLGNELAHTPTPAKVRCKSCSQESKAIFTIGWACLHSQCAKFFDFGCAVEAEDLKYHEDFLLERTPFKVNIDGKGRDNAPPDLRPALLTEETKLSYEHSGTEAECHRGIVCPKCHGCSRRVDWDGWKCEYAPCDFVYKLPLTSITAAEAIASGLESGVKKEKAKAKKTTDPGIRYHVYAEGLYTVTSYSIPGSLENGSASIIGHVIHYESCAAINDQIDGPDDLFSQMQIGDFNLKRKPVRCPGTRHEMLTSHWANNYGAPYKFVVRQNTTAFTDAPEVILKALKRMTWAGSEAADKYHESFTPFNELLAIGYMEDSKINYHDDGEKELGSTIATLSLGASALMRFRPKRTAELGAPSTNLRGTKTHALQLKLKHGDIVVMSGADIQKLYEHEVEPLGKLRFALTARHVKLDMMNTDEDRDDTVTKGALPKGHEQYDYDGDAHLHPGVHYTPRARIPAKTLTIDGHQYVLASSLKDNRFESSALASITST